MFVNHEPYLAMEICKKDEKCVCGASSELTNKTGSDCGYCPVCALKRKKFIEEIVGKIILSNQVNQMLIEPLELMRVKNMSDRIAFLIDSYFATRQDDTEPYDDVHFIIRCYHDKTDVLADYKKDIENFLYLLKTSKQNIGIRKMFIQKAYEDYFVELKNMYEDNWIEIKSLNEKRDKNLDESIKKMTLEIESLTESKEEE